jgi:hypothetical protein
MVFSSEKSLKNHLTLGVQWVYLIGMSKQPSAAMTEAYHLGLAQQGRNLTELIYSDELPEHIVMSRTLNAFWDAGYRGAEMPKWVRALRYGKIPAGGVSHNYRDDRQEPGVSVVRLLDDSAETQDGVSLFFLRAGRPEIIVEGWLVPGKHGSDGEPVLVGAVEA